MALGGGGLHRTVAPALRILTTTLCPVAALRFAARNAKPFNGIFMFERDQNAHKADSSTITASTTEIVEQDVTNPAPQDWCICAGHALLRVTKTLEMEPQLSTFKYPTRPGLVEWMLWLSPTQYPRCNQIPNTLLDTNCPYVSPET